MEPSPSQQNFHQKGTISNGQYGIHSKTRRINTVISSRQWIKCLIQKVLHFWSIRLDSPQWAQYRSQKFTQTPPALQRVQPVLAATQTEKKEQTLCHERYFWQRRERLPLLHLSLWSQAQDQKSVWALIWEEENITHDEVNPAKGSFPFGPPSPLFVSIIFFRNQFRTQTAEAKQQDGIYLPYCPPAQPLGWFYHIIANLNRLQCSANHTLHANEKTVLPQEWSLLRYGVRRSWLLSSEQIQVAQREVHRFRENSRNIIPGFGKLLALTLLPSNRHLQIQEANRELAAARFVL